MDVQRIPGDDIDVADALLSQAADSGADFLAKGGTRGCEFVLGGVTRSIFSVDDRASAALALEADLVATYVARR